MKLIILSLVLISVLAGSAAYADSSSITIKGSGVTLQNGDLPSQELFLIMENLRMELGYFLLS